MGSPFSGCLCLEYNEHKKQTEHNCLIRGHSDHLGKKFASLVLTEGKTRFSSDQPGATRQLAGELRIEHRSSDLESGVLPLNDSPTFFNLGVGIRVSGG